MSEDVLRGSDAEAVSAALRKSGWAAHTSVARELACWERLGREVNTYDATVDDYTNDLCSRDYLAHAIAESSLHLRQVLAERLTLADTTFREATVPDTEKLLGTYYRVDKKDGWWWHVRPANGPLATYLETPG